MLLSSFIRRKVVCWFLAAASPLIAFGQTNFSPQGVEYAIAGVFPGDQAYPCVAINSSGGCLVWQDNSVTTNGLRIRAERLNSGFTSLDGTNFVVSAVAKAKTTGDQEKPQVASLPGGGAVVVWQGGKTGLQQIFARFLNSAGSFITKDLRVSAFPRINQTNPQVAVLANGNVVVVWSSFGQDGSMEGIFARIFSATGSPLGAEFQVNQSYLYNQRSPALSALSDGRFVVVWISEMQRADPASVGVYARIFNASGLAAGGEFAVDATNTVSLCANPSVAGSPLGGFAVGWSQKDGVVQAIVSNPNDATGVAPGAAGFPAISWSTNGWDVFGRLFDAHGSPITSPFRLNCYTYGDQFAPKFSSLGAAYMAVWTSIGQDGSWEGVFGQFITPAGNLVFTNDLQVNTTWISRQFQPAVAADGVNRFLVVWSSFSASTSLDLFAQTYLQTGNQ